MVTLNPIGTVSGRDDGTASVILERRFAPALAGLADFSHVVIVWWADRAAGPEREELVQPAPYRGGPDRLGVFATRAPGRPNPLGLSVARLLAVDAEACTLQLDYLDAEPGTPVLDVKPYTPSLDRVQDPQVPAWSAGWPRCVEESGTFDWSKVFG